MKEGRVACFSAAIQRESRRELAEETGAQSLALRHIVGAIATSTLGEESDGRASFEVGCRDGLRRAGVFEGQMRPMSSSRLAPMFVEICSATARAAGDIDVAAAAMGTEADPEEIARGFMAILANERGIEAPEPAVQACTQGFARVFAGL